MYPKSFKFQASKNASSLNSKNEPARAEPALLIKMSILPNCSIVVETTFSTSSALVKSALTPITLASALGKN